MKKIIWVAMVVLFMVPLTLQAAEGGDSKNKEAKKELRMEQKQETKELRQSLKGQTPEERKAAMQKHREAQLASIKALQQGIHDKQMAELKEKLAQDKKLSDARKNEILAGREKQYQENMAYAEKRRSENEAFFKKLASDPKMTEDQKREALRAHFQSQQPVNPAMRQRKNESKSEREKSRSGVSTSTKKTAQ